MDVFHIESSNISSSLVDAVADGGDDITEVSFDAHSEFNLNFFDTPDDSVTTQGPFSEPASVESIASLSSTPPPPPNQTPGAASIEISSTSSSSSTSSFQPTSNTNNNTSTANQQLQQNKILLKPPILVNIQNGKFKFMKLQ